MRSVFTIFIFSVGLCFAPACTSTSSQAQGPKPNILWIFLEDTAPLMGAYGTTEIATPHIDQLAASGVLYTHAFMPAPVCSPS